MLKNYTNQALTRKSQTAIDEYGSPTYSSTTIQGRFEYKRKMIRNRDGREVLSQARIFTESAIRPGDVITFDSRDFPIIDVFNVYDLDGNLLFYEGAL